MGYIKDALRLHIYWWGILYGIFYLFAIALAIAGYMPTFGIANYGRIFSLFPLYGGLFTGFIILTIDRPRTWYGSQGCAFVLRWLVSTVSICLLAAYHHVTFGGKLYQSLIFYGMIWLFYVLALGHKYTSHRHQAQKVESEAKKYAQWFSEDAMGYLKDAFRLHIYWWGVFFGIFYMSAEALSKAGSLLFVLFLYASLLTGLLVLDADPIQRWHGTLGKATVVRLLASSLTTTVLIAFSTVVYGDFKETAQWTSFPWVLYVIALLVKYSSERHKRSGQDQPVKK